MTTHKSPIAWMHQIRDDPHTTKNRQLVLYSLALRMGRDGTGFASIRQLALDTGLSVSTVQRSLKWAQGIGMLRLTARGGRRGDRSHANEWHLEDAVPNRSHGDQLGGHFPTGQNGFPTGQNAVPNRSHGDHPREPIQENQSQDSEADASAALRTSARRASRNEPDRWTSLIDDPEQLETWLEELAGGLSPPEYNTANGMRENGSHPLAILNKLTADRRDPWSDTYRPAQQQPDPWATDETSQTGSQP